MDDGCEEMAQHCFLTTVVHARSSPPVFEDANVYAADAEDSQETAFVKPTTTVFSKPSV